MRTMLKQRCPRCESNLFLSDDPMDSPGTLYCLAGHTFYAKPADPQERTTRVRPAASAA